MRKVMALTALAASLLAACSSDGDSASSSARSSAPVPSPSESTCDDACLRTFSPPAPEPSQTEIGYGDQQAVITFVDSNRVTIENMVAQAAAVKQDAKDGSIDDGCVDLGGAVSELQVALPAGNPDPLVEALTEAASNYENASNACDSEGQAEFVVSNINDGDDAVMRAEARAKELGIRL